MANKASSIAIYLFWAILSAAVYGLFAFFVIYRGLSGEVMLNAYLWNIGFIIAILLVDKIANDILLSKDFVITRKNYFFTVLIHMASFISFKTTLYLFYTFILVLSRVSLLDPDLFTENFRNFVLAIEYCLILVVIVDKFTEYLLKDDRRIQRVTAKFERFSRFVATKHGSKNEL